MLQGIQSNILPNLSRTNRKAAFISRLMYISVDYGNISALAKCFYMFYSRILSKRLGNWFIIKSYIRS